MKSLRLPVCLTVLVVGWAAGLAATACDTPVYRFAMYSKKWAPWPYVVAYLHSGQEAKEDAAVHGRLKQLIEEQGEFTNIRLESFDATAEETFAELPPEVLAAWDARQDKDQPLHVVTNPMGAVIYSGRLKVNDIDPLIDSPARQKEAKLLAGGKIVFALVEERPQHAADPVPTPSPLRQNLAQFNWAIYGGLTGAILGLGLALVVCKRRAQRVVVLLACLLAGVLPGLVVWAGAPTEEMSVKPQPPRVSPAEQTVLDVVQLAQEGKIKGGAAAGDQLLPGDLVPRAVKPDTDVPSGDDSGGDAKPKDEPKLEVALLKISPSDPNEIWLIRMLKRADPEPMDEKLAGEPMVFALYGRGRAMPPYIGKGITTENLITLQGINFLSGPCSCEVKEQNPGLDLLTTNDWEAAAEQMARIFGDEEGNEGLLDVTSLVPSLGGEKMPVPTVSDPGGSRANVAASTSPDESSAAPAVTRGVGNRMARYVGIGVGCVLLLLLLGSLPLLSRGS